MQSCGPALVGVLGLLLSACEPDTARTFVAIREPPATCASLERSAIDFGSVVPFGNVRQTVRLLNPTLSRLSVRLEPVPAPFSASPAGNFLLQPGGELITLFFTPRDGRAYQSELVLTQDDPRCPPRSVRLTGSGIPSVVVPPRLDFGAIPIGVESVRTATLFNATASTASVQLNASDPFRVDATAVTIAPSASLDVQVRVTPRRSGPMTGTLGSFISGTGVLFTTLEASAGVPKLELDTTPATVPTLPLEVPGVPALSRTVQLFNGGDGPLAITRVEITPENFTSNALEVRVTLPAEALEAGQSGSLNVALAPRGMPGPRAWSVTLITNEPAQPSHVLHFSGDAAAIEPCASPVTVSATATLAVPPYPRDVVVTFTNPNSTVCLVDDVRMSSTDWSLSPQVTQEFVLGQQSFTRTVGIPAAGTERLGFTTFGNVSGYTFLNFNASP